MTDQAFELRPPAQGLAVSPSGGTRAAPHLHSIYAPPTQISGHLRLVRARTRAPDTGAHTLPVRTSHEFASPVNVGLCGPHSMCSALRRHSRVRHRRLLRLHLREPLDPYRARASPTSRRCGPRGTLVPSSMWRTEHRGGGLLRCSISPPHAVPGSIHAFCVIAFRYSSAMPIAVARWPTQAAPCQRVSFSPRLLSLPRAHALT